MLKVLNFKAQIFPGWKGNTDKIIQKKKEE